MRRITEHLKRSFSKRRFLARNSRCYFHFIPKSSRSNGRFQDTMTRSSRPEAVVPPKKTIGDQPVSDDKKNKTTETPANEDAENDAATEQGAQSGPKFTKAPGDPTSRCQEKCFRCDGKYGRKDCVYETLRRHDYWCHRLDVVGALRRIANTSIFLVHISKRFATSWPRAPQVAAAYLHLPTALRRVSLTADHDRRPPEASA